MQGTGFAQSLSLTHWFQEGLDIKRTFWIYLDKAAELWGLAVIYSSCIKVLEKVMQPPDEKFIMDLGAD